VLRMNTLIHHHHILPAILEFLKALAAQGRPA
jgi:hypothetical protein